MAIMPMPAAQAAADPDIAAMTMLAAMAALERPPIDARAHAPKAEKAFRNSAHRHEIPHEKKERNGHERDARNLGEHALRHEKKPRDVAARKKKRRDGAKPIVTAVVTPINISTNTAEKMRNIVMREARSSEFPKKNNGPDNNRITGAEEMRRLFSPA